MTVTSFLPEGSAERLCALYRRQISESEDKLRDAEQAATQPGSGDVEMRRVKGAQARLKMLRGKLTQWSESVPY